MSVVFIGGSRRLSRLNAAIRGRLDNITERGHSVIIGDANGGDRAVQEYFAERGYQAVTVYCTNGRCRNNLGQWPVQSVEATTQRGFDYYALKDAAMAADADCGFMLWDGKSKGTLSNIHRLLSADKPVVVYLAADQKCHTIRCEAELAALAPSPTSVTRQRHRSGDGESQSALFPGNWGAGSSTKPLVNRRDKRP